MVTQDYVPVRGDIVHVNFSSQEGHEQSGARPAIVLSPYLYNKKSGLCICAPITSKKKGYPFEVELSEGMSTFGVILADQLRTLDWRARSVKKIEEIGPDALEDVLIRARLLLAS